MYTDGTLKTQESCKYKHIICSCAKHNCKVFIVFDRQWFGTSAFRSAEHSYTINPNILSTPELNINIKVFIIPFDSYNRSSSTHNSLRLQFFFQRSVPLNGTFYPPLCLTLANRLLSPMSKYANGNSLEICKNRKERYKNDFYMGENKTNPQ